ncbi:MULTISPECIES: thiolase family protein [unclassified Micromonospora]|uniref:thiolase family protein n=1 Tax=unclassified Micromonospora TaxID=2617518 RepID=UPI00188F02C0|nr:MULTISPECIES: thiolase family protein [unclassified Micromonospora]MBF5028771.1 thiolase family protein [Micromonospora sp. ANENR4]MCZ7476100.1 thiolase family protein [Micromonospora sp. WMMC273]WBC00962.1 thiolase family protein [Micromonospora sp. WMMA1976]
MDRQAFLVGAVRTPHGRYGGALRDVRVVRLGGLAGAEALTRAGVPAEAVDETVVANCRQAGNGPNPGRQISLAAGVPVPVPAQTINMACASGLKAVQLAHRSVLAGEADVALAVAAESMSTMPYLAPYTLRWDGVRRGDVLLQDGWRDGGTDPICGMSMGETAEKVAREFGVSRADQDAWSARSHQRLARAWESGAAAREVLPLDELDRDETVRPDTTPDRLARLRPSFTDGGTVTAGNASQMADGAAAVVVASGEAVRRHGLTPLGRIVGFAAVGVDPTMMGVGPAEAIPLALRRAGLTVGDVDLFEINEAFAAQIVQNVRALGLDEERVNVNGGGIALGHPTGQSGARLVVSLLHELARRDGRYGVASLCVGGGQGIAAVIERVTR